MARSLLVSQGGTEGEGPRDRGGWGGGGVVLVEAEILMGGWPRIIGTAETGKRLYDDERQRRVIRFARRAETKPSFETRSSDSFSRQGHTRTHTLGKSGQERQLSSCHDAQGAIFWER